MVSQKTARTREQKQLPNLIFQETTIDLKKIRRAAFGGGRPPDLIVGISQNAIQKFLITHYTNNPEFYDRSRERNPNNPIYEHTFNDHGTQRRVRFWAKVVRDAGQPPIIINLASSATDRARFQVWWKSIYGDSGPQDTPPNVNVLVPRTVLQINFPKLDGSGGEHQIDLSVKIEIAAYLRLDSSAGKYTAQLVNWDVKLTPLDDPADPNAPIWGNNPLPAPCVKEIKRLRLIIRDLFTLGGNIALTQLASTLTANLPLPPFDVVKGIDVNPQTLTISNRAIILGLLIQASSVQARVSRAFQNELQRFNEDLGDSDLGAILSRGPVREPDKLAAYMLENVPAYKALDKRLKNLLDCQKNTSKEVRPSGIPKTDLFIFIAGGVFDLIAKTFLKADEKNCTDWLGIDLGVVYGQGRACYWFSLLNARGGLNGTTISMGANFRAGGGLELKACVRIPCLPDQCASWSPGIGLAGPCDLNISIDNSAWYNNRALRFSAQFSAFPGFEVYGLPPGLSDIANAVLNFLTSVILKAFFNAILQTLDFYLIQVPIEITSAKVKLNLSDFGATNDSGYLVLTGSTSFS